MGLSWSLTGTICVFASTTGIPCPGCGLTRAVVHALRGDLPGAFQMHPLFWLGPLLLAGLPIIAWRSPGFLRTRLFRMASIAVIFMFFLVYVIRMATEFPGAAPMAYNMDSYVGHLIRWVSAG